MATTKLLLDCRLWYWSADAAIFQMDLGLSVGSWASWVGLCWIVHILLIQGNVGVGRTTLSPRLEARQLQGRDSLWRLAAHKFACIPRAVLCGCHIDLSNCFWSLKTPTEFADAFRVLVDGSLFSFGCLFSGLDPQSSHLPRGDVAFGDRL